MTVTVTVSVTKCGLSSVGYSAVSYRMSNTSLLNLRIKKHTKCTILKIVLIDSHPKF